MESDKSANRYNSAKRYIGFSPFRVRYHLTVYMKRATYRLTDKSFCQGDILGGQYIIWAAISSFPLYKCSMGDNYNPGQGISNRIEKSGEYLLLRVFSLLLPKFNFWKVDWALGYVSTQI